ncbi:chromate efflux transporter [Mycolicibacterium fluoranthenivorans]|nr:chromate efflux transporter [Mycolicibacterium fluoranthenivorans]
MGESRVPLMTIAGQWGRIGCLGFGGPPAHIALLRELCVQRRRWLDADEFEDAIAAMNLLPGPASTQLAIYTAWRLRGFSGAIVGGLAFILPGLFVILALAAFFLSGGAPGWARGAAAGAGAAVAAVAVHAAFGLIPSSWQRAGVSRWNRARWIGYFAAGALAAALTGPWLVLVLIAAGLLEITARVRPSRAAAHAWPVLLAAAPALAGIPALLWTAFKVGALSYGGGFVIIPLMQDDAVRQHHWMTDAEFLNAVALGQLTPGPVLHTVAVVGYAAAGLGGALLAALFAFGPSFVMVIAGGRHFDALRANRYVQAFLAGAGPAVIGAITGSAVPLALGAEHAWQFGVLAAAAVALLIARRGVVGTLVGAALLGVGAYLIGWPVG